jgi:hypothetical protein
MSVGSDTLLTDPVVGPNNQLQVDALKNILGIGTGALALGAGARGLSGLGSFFGRNVGGGPRTPQRQSFVRIPVPVAVRSRAERDELLAATEQDKEAGLAKLAEDALTTVANMGGLLRQPGQKPGLLHETFGGWNEPGMLQKPWTYLPAAAAAAGGLYGGWKLTDYLLDKTKNVEQESELEAARKDYEEALAGRRKLASAESGPLDELAALYEKRALLNEGLGLATLGLGGIAALSGLGTYNWTRSIAEDKAVEEAVKRRQAQIAEQSPSPIMAIPTPVPVLRPGRSHWDHLMGHKPGPERPRKLDHEKAANIGQAADQFLGRIKNNQMAVWQRLMTPTDAKPAKPPAGSDKPAPPQLPTLAGTRAKMIGPQSA